MSAASQPSRSADNEPQQRRPARNMHEDIDETCDDICSCEPEPRWQEVAEENERREREESSRR